LVGIFCNAGIPILEFLTQALFGLCWRLASLHPAVIPWPTGHQAANHLHSPLAKRCPGAQFLTKHRGIVMASSHFAIERPRRISISIQGYDAKAKTEEQKRKRFESHRRKDKRDKRRAQEALASNANASAQAASELEAMSVAAGQPAAQQAPFERELADAFTARPGNAKERLYADG
jgi:hypothetical protein